jgi:hypothetical protein
LDEFIIGTWIKNHESVESYEKDLANWEAT